MLEQAEKLFNSGNHMAARLAYTKILQKQPSNIVAAANLGKLLLMDRDFAGAEPLLRRTLKFFPKVPEVYQNLMTCYLHLEENDKAIELIKIAETELPDSAVIELLNNELKKPPIPLQNALIDLYAKNQFLDCEIGAYLLLEEYPETILAMQVLAFIEHKQGKIEQAFMRRKRLAELHPREINVLSQLSESYLAMGMLEEALLTAKKAVSLSASNKDALAVLQNATQAIKAKKKEQGAKTTLSLRKAA